MRQHPQPVIESIDTQLCEDCDPFTSNRIVDRLHQEGWEIVARHELNMLRWQVQRAEQILNSDRMRRIHAGVHTDLTVRCLRPLLEEWWDDFGGWNIDDMEARRG